MKKVYIIAASTILAASCTKYLDVKPRGYDVPSTVEQFSGLIYGQDYFYLDEVFEFMSFEFTTDAEGYKKAYSEMGSDVCNAYRWQKDIFLQDQASGEWNSPTSYLYGLNVVVNEVDGATNGTSEQKKAIKAEARVLRAWLHFMMAQCFGLPYDPTTAASDRCIPIIDKAATVGAQFPMRSVKEVYDFILREMQESIPDLADEEEHFLRVFKPTGQAMLGKVLWTMGRYAEARPLLSEALKGALEKGRSLLDFNTIVTAEGTLDYPTDMSAHPEYLFQYASMARLMPAVYATLYNTALFPIREDVLFHYFKAGDIRLASLVDVKSGKTAYTSFKTGVSYAPNTGNMISNFGIGLPDLYLMCAECLARAGKDSEALALLKEFRACRMDAASAGAVSGDLVVAAVEERMREFIGFGNTWFDTRRLWDDPKFQYMKDYYTRTDGTDDYTLTKERLAMEIPPQILSWHPEYSNFNQ